MSIHAHKSSFSVFFFSGVNINLLRRSEEFLIKGRGSTGEILPLPPLNAVQDPSS